MLIHQHDAWIVRLASKYGLPRALIVRMHDRPGALEDEIAAWIIEHAADRARALFADNLEAPAGDDMYTRAVRGLHAQLVAHRDAAREAERLAQYKATDEMLRQMKAEQQQ
jgi:hypothetical protein